MKSIFYLVVLFAGFFTACSKDPIVEKVSEPSGNFSRSFFFPRNSTTETVITNQPSTVNLNSRYNSAEALVIGVNVTLPSGNEQVGLIIKKK